MIGFAYPDYMQEVYDAGVKLPRGESELPLLKRFTVAPSEKVSPPRIEQCWLSLEARFLWDHETGDHMTCCVEIIRAVFDKRYWQEHHVLRRSGVPGVYYITHGNFFSKGEISSFDHSQQVREVDKNNR